MSIVQSLWPVSGTVFDGNPADLFGGLPISTTIYRTGEAYSWLCSATTTGTASQEIRAQDGGYANVGTNNATYSFYFYVTTLPAANSEEICEITDTGSVLKMALRIKSDGKLQAYQTNGTSQMGSDTTAALSTGTWYRIEVQCGTGASAAWEIRLYDDNDSPALLDTISGTGNVSTTAHRGIKIGKVTNRNGQTVSFNYTGVRIRNDLTWIGHARYKVCLPDGNGTYTAWTGVYTAVDEAPPHDGTTTTISSSTSGSVETVTLQDCATVGISGSDTINCVRAICMTKPGGGSNTSTIVRTRSGGADYDSSIGQAQTGGGAPWVAIASVRDVDPATSAAWTTSGIDAVEIGPRMSNANAAQVTAIWLLVDYTPGAAPPASANGNFFLFFGM